ncbi:MAG: acetyl-CoA carboxylase biotin carboxyl carrier protein, partial [Steroidobacteraceae bacterium]
MDIRKIKKLIELLEESGLAEIEISEGEESVRIARYNQGVAVVPQGAAPAPAAAPETAVSPPG